MEVVSRWNGAGRGSWRRPAKSAADRSHGTQLLLLSQLLEMTSSPQAQFDLVSPYFIPGKQGERRLADLAASGVRVRILTNSELNRCHRGAWRLPEIP